MIKWDGERSVTRAILMRGAAALVFGAAFLSASLPVAAAAARHSTSPVILGERRTAGEMMVPVNKSQMLRVNRPFGEITVGNRDIADVVPISKTQAYVIGKKPGTTSLAMLDGQGHAIAVVDVVVSGDIEGLKASLHEILPGEPIEVRGAPGAIVLSGTVSSADRLRQVLAMAERYSPGAVTNMLSIGGSQQVLLHVRFAEVQRTTARELGINNNLIYQSGGNTYQFFTGSALQSGQISADAFGAAAARIIGGHYTLDTAIDALENKGLVRTLAEPNVIALSGDTAKFLAGGEFPIPVANNLTNAINTITVEFKEFGVGLSFTPTVVGKELINLVIKSEVSSIDPSVSVTTNQITIPGLKVRRANTTVEIKDGQSFAIAGLVQDDFRDTVKQIPGFGDIPILGALLRSSNFKREQTELVIFVTAHLVQPVTREALASPTDNAAVPSSTDLFFAGKPEGQAAAGAAAGKAGGVDGPHGYILP